MSDSADPQSAGRALEPVITVWRAAPDEVWARVRDDYLAGLSAPACCRRHGVGLSTLRERAAREGWRRADQPWPAPAPLDDGDEGLALEAEAEGDLNRIELWSVVEVADRRMLRAVLRGDAVAALRWRRVRDAMNEEARAEQRFRDEEAAFETRRQALSPPDGPDGLDGSDGLLPSAPTPPGPPPPASPDGPDGLDGVSPPPGPKP